MQEQNDSQRDKTIIRTSFIGILVNTLLACFKGFLGILGNSIAITLDAINNLSDAASSLITILGTKLSKRAPNRKHPFGYGRIEYLSAMLISIIVLYAGLTSFQESLKKIFNPEKPEYSSITLIIVFVAIIVKILLGFYVKHIGIKTNSDSLINSGKDAILDSVISISTFVAAVVYLWKGISLEAYLGFIISIVIIKAGIEMLFETLSKILGERADIELSNNIKQTVLSFPNVTGVYDLILNNYGPNAFNASLHIEVPDTYTADQLDELSRAITLKVYMQYHVALTAIGIYSVNTTDTTIIEMRKKIFDTVLANKHILQVHGFYVNQTNKTIRFDVIISFDAKDRNQTFLEICQSVQNLYPDYTLQLAMDTDYSET